MRSVARGSPTMSPRICSPQRRQRGNTCIVCGCATHATRAALRYIRRPGTDRGHRAESGHQDLTETDAFRIRFLLLEVAAGRSLDTGLALRMGHHSGVEADGEISAAPAAGVSLRLRCMMARDHWFAVVTRMA